MRPLPPEDFDELVVRALDELDPRLLEPARNVAIVTGDEDPDDPLLLGVYEGVPLTEREDYSGVLPDRIVLYRVPLCVLAADLQELEHEVRVTVVHELAHHVGLDEARLSELGWG